jgi:hypothetical protein
MRHGDELRLLSSGLRLQPHQAASLGLLHNSIAWGMWVEGKGGKTRARMSSPSDPTASSADQGPHLMVSTIHPDRWPAVFGLEIRIRRARGTLRTLLAKLRDLGINCLTISSAGSGYDLSIVKATCEYSPLTEWVRTQLVELDAAVSHEQSRLGEGSEADVRIVKEVHRLRRKCMQQIGLRHIAVATHLHASIQMWDQSIRHDPAAATGLISGFAAESDPPPVPFLHDRSVVLGLNPWFLSAPDLDDSSAISEVARSLGLQFKEEVTDHYPLDEHVRKYLGSIEDFAIRHPLQADVQISEAARRAGRFKNEGFSVSIREWWRQASKPAVQVFPLISLAHARIWSFVSYAPMKFRYHATNHLLSALEEGATSHMEPFTRIHRDLAEIGGITDLVLLDSPLVAMCHFNSKERSLRLRFQQHWFAAQISYQIEVEYEWSAAEAASSHGRVHSPSGLLEQFTRAAYRQKMTVERVESILYEQADGYEHGRFRLIVSRSDAGYSTDVRAREAYIVEMRVAMGQLMSKAARQGYIPGVNVIRVDVVPLAHAVETRSQADASGSTGEMPTRPPRSNSYTETQ